MDGNPTRYQVQATPDRYLSLSLPALFEPNHEQTCLQGPFPSATTQLVLPSEATGEGARSIPRSGEIPCIRSRPCSPRASLPSQRSYDWSHTSPLFFPTLFLSEGSLVRLPHFSLRSSCEVLLPRVPLSQGRGTWVALQLSLDRRVPFHPPRLRCTSPPPFVSLLGGFLAGPSVDEPHTAGL